jgi:hypothetical protein
MPTRKQASAPGAVLKPISLEYHQTLCSRLAGNELAMAYLTGSECGLDAETIRHFGLGLSMPYTRRGNALTMSDALVAPFLSPMTGQPLKRSAYVCIPGVTQNPVSQVGWMKGNAATYWSGKENSRVALFVCSGLKEVWRHWQALLKAGMTDRIMVVCSPHPSAIPAEWRRADFWAPWEKIYLGLDDSESGDQAAGHLLEFIGREAYRVKVPRELGQNWVEYWRNGGDAEILRSLLKQAPAASAIGNLQPQNTAGPQPGRYSYRPVDINGAYVNGHLYYPTETRVAEIDEKTGTLVERRETIVIRSDRTVHRAVYAPAPQGTPTCQRIMRLTDGTVIEKEPRASSGRTWDFESIDRYIRGTEPARQLAAILAETLAVLQQAVWLPYSEDYVALALTVPATYVQAVFEAVPLLLLNGPAGSGKTQTGNTMARLCANGVVIGQVSAASAARLIDETRGFVVLDDVESIAAKAGKDVQVNELVQALKVSYNRHTAKKIWTDVKTMRTEKLDFFGIKMLNNTLGADSILGSRMLRIQTRKMPEGMKSGVREFAAEDLLRLHALRNELHAWAFENVRAVENTYREIYAGKSDRQAEIAAPLRTMAHLVGDLAITADLETCLARQAAQGRAVNNDPVEILTEAVRNLVRQGYDKATLVHIQLEMRSLLDVDYCVRGADAVPDWDQPEWIGRQLRSSDLVEIVNPGRRRILGRNLRLVQIAGWLRKEVTESGRNQPLPVINRSPEDFCSDCASCPYRSVGCELQVNRVRKKSL